MESFSERQGLKPRRATQSESMNTDLKNRLWNLFYKHFLRDTDSKLGMGKKPSTNLRGFSEIIWAEFFKLEMAIFDRPNWTEIENMMKISYDNLNWNEVYDFVEFIYYKAGSFHYNIADFKEDCNKILEGESAAYRLVDSRIVPIIDSSEIAEIESAANSPYETIKAHIKEALALMAKRDKSGFRNSIKESISAVECMAKKIAGSNKGTLPDALKMIADKIELHPAFREGLIKIYGYTSDADGIRHALMDESNLQSADARFMLVICSAFVNYLRYLNDRE